jgi:selenobiotic family peptide radical SAM maturase
MTYAQTQDGKRRLRVTPSSEKELEKVYLACRSTVDSDTWGGIIAACAEGLDPETLPNVLRLHTGDLGLPDFLPELARLEWAVHKVKDTEIEIPAEVDQLGVNPTVQLLQLSWKNLCSILNSENDSPLQKPEPGDEFVLVWLDQKSLQAKTQPASDEDLLVLKMVVEGLDPKEVAAAGGLPVGAVDAAIHRAVYRGILLQPRSRIRRDPARFPVGENTNERFLSSGVFTIQWHITQACDLHCKHCYDRSDRSPLKLDDAFAILDDLRDFCRSRHVRGQVSFTGGNPLLYPHFLELYRGASDRGLGLAILGNPAPRARIKEMLAIQRPAFFQVSLEGLQGHNDMIRGRGNFERVIEFLGVLRDLEVISMVMLTLTKGNIDQVLPLADRLGGLSDHFNFNRLSMVGEGANLQLPTPQEYHAFLEAYMKAAESNPVMGLKDNLMNIVRYQKGMEPFGGCAGYGCSAAFNFITVLSDGEAHACRKFPSPIGNVFEQSIEEIYESEMAHRYRSGCQACGFCPIRPVCGGCLAIAHSFGLNIFEERDPYCFMTISQ